MNMTTTSRKMIDAAELASVRRAKYGRRKLVNQLALTLSMAAMLFGIFWLIWILWETIRLGVGGLSLALFSQMTPPPNEAGANAIIGSLIMVALATFVGTPIGVMAGVYLAEYDKKGWLASVTRFVNDILLSAPSIVIGLFVYAVVVARFKSFSGYAGIVALALIVIPVVIRTTENMLMLVPASLREAAYALGTPKWKVITLVTLRAARAGVITGVLLAVARIAGETAPLLLIGMISFVPGVPHAIDEPVGALPSLIYIWENASERAFHERTAAAILVLLAFMIVMNAAAVLLRRRFERRW